jgi:hypothetical protein
MAILAARQSAAHWSVVLKAAGVAWTGSVLLIHLQPQGTCISSAQPVLTCTFIS